MQLKVSYEDECDGITVVRVIGGALDVRSAPELRKMLVQLDEDGRLILVVDLRAIDAIDGTGLGVLVGGLKRVHLKGGAVSLVVTDEWMRRILSKTGLTRVFHIYDTVPSAVATLVAAYAEESIEQGIIESGDHTYEHLSEDITLVRVGVDELDGYTVPPLRKLLVDLVNHGRFYLVVDLTGTDHMSSTGVGAFVGVLKRIRAHNGGLALVVPNESVLKMFRMTGLIKVFPIFDTVDPAVEHLGRNVPKAHV